MITLLFYVAYKFEKKRTYTLFVYLLFFRTSISIDIPRKLHLHRILLFPDNCHIHPDPLVLGNLLYHFRQYPHKHCHNHYTHPLLTVRNPHSLPYQPLRFAGVLFVPLLLSLQHLLFGYASMICLYIASALSFSLFNR